jgi:hypothetical protein
MRIPQQHSYATREKAAALPQSARNLPPKLVLFGGLLRLGLGLSSACSKAEATGCA